MEQALCESHHCNNIPLLNVLEKSQHLAIGQKEEYEEWLYMYRKDRDAKMGERRLKMESEWLLWRKKFGSCL